MATPGGPSNAPPRAPAPDRGRVCETHACDEREPLRLSQKRRRIRFKVQVLQFGSHKSNDVAGTSSAAANGAVSGIPRSPRSCRRCWRSARRGPRQGSIIRGWSCRPGGPHTGPGTIAGLRSGAVPGAGVPNVPVAGDLGCIFLVEYRVKDRLPGQAWRPLAPSPRPRSGPVPPARSAATASHCQARQPCLTILAVISSRHWISSLCRHSCVAAIRVMQVGCCASTATWWGWTGRPGGISSISRRAQNRGVPAGPLSITATADPRPGHHGDHDRACHHVNGSHRA